MIKLKTLITEQVLDKGLPFSLSDRDPYEYKQVNNIWYTKRKTAADWLDMKSKISPANYTIAVDRLNRELAIGKVDTKKPAVDPKKSKVDIIPKVDFIPKVDIIPGLDQIDVKDKTKLVKQDLGIKRNPLGYITSKKSAVYDKQFTLRTNMNQPSVVILKKVDIDDINRSTGRIDHSSTDVVATLWPEDTKYYAIGDIKTIVMPDLRGSRGTVDKDSGREFTYLYIVGTNGYKGWIPSNTVKIIS
jgi:hypothetical protein